LRGDDEVVERFGDAVERGVRLHVTVAPVHKRIVLGELGRHSYAIIANEQLVGRFRDAADL
jgi:hypothetical protein